MVDRVIRIGTAEAKPGTRADGVLRVARLNDASFVEIPVIVMHGAQSGRHIWIQSGVHGNEYVGAAAMHTLISELDPATLAGAIVFIPVANIVAYRAVMRSAPQDGLDMNRVWPGNDLANARSLSAHTEVVVRCLFEAITYFADVVIDCHAGGWPNRMGNWVAYVDTGDLTAVEARRLAHATGFDIIWHRSAEFAAARVGGSLSGLLATHGKPNLVLEAGGEGRVDGAPVDRMTIALRNILRLSGVLTGDPEGMTLPRSVVRGNWLRATEGGMLRLAASLLQEVRQGELICTITDLFGEVVEEVRAPVSGVLIGMRTLAMINSGEFIANVAEYA
jgi:predicted deacylase